MKGLGKQIKGWCYIVSDIKEFNCSGKATIYFRGVERGRNMDVSGFSDVVDLMKKYFKLTLSTDSDFLTVDKLDISQFSYEIKEVEEE